MNSPQDIGLKTALSPWKIAVKSLKHMMAFTGQRIYFCCNNCIPTQISNYENKQIPYSNRHFWIAGVIVQQEQHPRGGKPNGCKTDIFDGEHRCCCVSCRT